jgi:hypothetical protein
MPDIRGKKGRKTAMGGTDLVHPDFTLTLEHLRIKRFQAPGAYTFSVLDFSALATGIGRSGECPGFLRHIFQARAIKIHRQTISRVQ